MEDSTQELDKNMASMQPPSSGAEASEKDDVRVEFVEKDSMQETKENINVMQSPLIDAQASEKDDERNASPIMRKTSVDLGLWNYIYDQSADFGNHFYYSLGVLQVREGPIPEIVLDLKEILDRRLYVPKSNQRRDTYIDSIVRRIEKGLDTEIDGNKIYGISHIEIYPCFPLVKPLVLKYSIARRPYYHPSALVPGEMIYLFAVDPLSLEHIVTVRSMHRCD